MPITQARFLAIIDAAAKVVELNRNLSKASYIRAQLIVEVNSVIANTNDSAIRMILQEMLGSINTIRDILNESDEVAVGLSAQILAEQQYFNRVANANDRTAYKQRQARRMKGVMPREIKLRQEPMPMPTFYNAPVQNDFPGEVVLKTDADLDNDPDYQALLEHTRAKWKEGNGS